MDSKQSLARSFAEVDLNIIESLKAKGFNSIRFELQRSADYQQARIEVIPGKEQDFQLDTIALNSPETFEYFNAPSPMARYVIDKEYLD